MNRFTHARLLSFLLRSCPSLEQYPHADSRGSDAGVTLLEALVALLVITVTLAVITPPIFIATATRVSNRRTEQAMQLAQGEIERVRLLMLSSQPYQNDIPNNIIGIDAQLPPISVGATKNTIEQVGAPASTCELPEAGDPAPTTVPCSDLQLAPTANNRLFIQTFREDGAALASGDVVAFRMGVRVYGSEAIGDDGQPVAGLLNQPGNVKFTTGAGSRISRPLVAFYTEMIRGTEGGGLAAMQNPSWD